MNQLLKESLVLEEIEVAGYEKVIKVTDESTALTAIICVHSTLLGPALGGTRIFPYPTFEAALTDVKRLSKGMTYKSAVAETGLGGGKSVIIADSKKKSKEMLIAFAAAVHRLEGLYTCAEDVGCSMDDVTIIGEHTPYVTGLKHEKSSGNPAPFTAWGTFRGIQATLKKKFGSDSIEGRIVAIQGLGSVGALLADLLFWHGAKLILSDIDWEKTVRLAKRYQAKAVPAEDILMQPCDVLAPCALGGVINPETIENLNCHIVAGCANNQLLTDSEARSLEQRGILYAPDFVINAGGLINVTQELEEFGYDASLARGKVNRIYDQLTQIYELAESKGISTQEAAVALGDHRLEKGIGKRVNPPTYHHFTPKS